MEISGKRKRKENEDDGGCNTDEEEIEKFCEIVERFRAPYNWFRAKLSGFATVTNCNDRNKRIVEDDSKRAEVWTPVFLLEDFVEEDVIKSSKSTQLRISEAAAPTTEAAAPMTAAEEGEEKKESNEELNLRLSL